MVISQWTLLDVAYSGASEQFWLNVFPDETNSSRGW